MEVKVEVEAEAVVKMEEQMKAKAKAKAKAKIKEEVAGALGVLMQCSRCQEEDIVSPNLNVFRFVPRSLEVLQQFPTFSHSFT